jgi:hypothetical protein
MHGEGVGGAGCQIVDIYAGLASAGIDWLARLTAVHK